MVTPQIPKWKKQTPTNFPELQKDYEDLFHKLHVEQGIGKSKSLEMVGEHYGVSRITAAFHIFRSYKITHQKSNAKNWNRIKGNPGKQKEANLYSKNYQNARNHIGDYMQICFQNVPEGEALPLDYLVECIHHQTNIRFSPKTIVGLAEHQKSKNGPLLIEVPGYGETAHYTISKYLQK